MTMLQNHAHLQLEFTNPYVIIMQLHINVAFSSTPMCYESFGFLLMHSALFVTNKYNTILFRLVVRKYEYSRDRISQWYCRGIDMTTLIGYFIHVSILF